MRMRKKASYTHRAHHSLGDRRRPVPTAVRMRTRKQQAGRRPPAAARGPTEITDDDRCGEERECVDMRCAFGLLVFFASASGSCWSVLQYPGSALFPYWGCDASAAGNSLITQPVTGWEQTTACIGGSGGMQRWQWTRYQLKLYVGATVCMQREQLRHSSLRRFEAGWERSAGCLLFSSLSASEDFSADMDSFQPMNSPHNTCSYRTGRRIGAKGMEAAECRRGVGGRG